MQLNFCKNCEHLFQGNFCSNCGQKTTTQRLDFDFILDELKYTFFHINNGLLYTIKQLFTRPGLTIAAYLEGKRVKHYKPILMVFVLAGLNGLMLHYLKIEETIKPSKYSDVQQVKKIFVWITTHYAIVELALIPFVSISSWLTFRKWGYNYIENIVINSFASSQRLCFGLLTFPILLLCFKYNITSGKNWIAVPEYFLTAWTFWQLYANKKPLEKVLRLVLMVLFIVILFLVIIVLATFAYIAFSKFLKI